MSLPRALAIIRRVNAEDAPERGLRRFLPRDVDAALVRLGLDVRNETTGEGATIPSRFVIVAIRTGKTVKTI